MEERQEERQTEITTAELGEVVVTVTKPIGHADDEIPNENWKTTVKGVSDEMWGITVTHCKPLKWEIYANDGTELTPNPDEEERFYLWVAQCVMSANEQENEKYKTLYEKMKEQMRVRSITKTKSTLQEMQQHLRNCNIFYYASLDILNKVKPIPTDDSSIPDDVREQVLLLNERQQEPLENITLSAVESDSKEVKQFPLLSGCHFPMLHSSRTDWLMDVVGVPLDVNATGEKATITNPNKQFTLELQSCKVPKLTASAVKLLYTAIGAFTNVNHTGHTARKVYYDSVNIPTKEYASKLGYEVYSKDDTKQERNRANNAMKNARRKIKRDAELLTGAKITAVIKKRKKDGTTEEINDNIVMIGRITLDDGYIMVKFFSDFAEHLIKQPQTQFPIKLLRMDERNDNAIKIGYAMAVHANNYNNIIKKTANRLKVKTLLQHTTLPTADSEAVKKNGYVERMKEPFETCLDGLYQDGVLKEWSYIEKNKAGEDVEIDPNKLLTDIHRWLEVNVQYEFNEKVDHTERLKARESEKEKAKKKPKKKQPKKRKTESKTTES